MSAKFGPAGNSDSFSAKYKSSSDAPVFLKEIGLDCYEYQSCFFRLKAQKRKKRRKNRLVIHIAV